MKYKEILKNIKSDFFKYKSAYGKITQYIIESKEIISDNKDYKKIYVTTEYKNKKDEFMSESTIIIDNDGNEIEKTEVFKVYTNSNKGIVKEIDRLLELPKFDYNNDNISRFRVWDEKDNIYNIFLDHVEMVHKEDNFNSLVYIELPGEIMNKLNNTVNQYRKIYMSTYK